MYVLTVSNDQNCLKKVIKSSKTLMKRSVTFRNGHGTVRNGHSHVHANGQERWTLNGQGRLGTFESERNNALERIVEKVQGAFTVRSRSRFKNERNTVNKSSYLFFEISHYHVTLIKRL